MENKEIKLDPTIALNYIIKTNPAVVTNEISDGYHTFGELYEHRIVLWIALCRAYNELVNHVTYKVWKTRKHSDNTAIDGWFLLGITAVEGKQITYHLPEKYWNECDFDVLDKAPEFDGHTSKDVLERIKQL